MLPLENRIKLHAHDLGFELAGIAPATPADGFDRLRQWLDQGFAGEMAYMERHAEARKQPSSVFPEVQSVVMVGMNYKPEEGRGKGASPLLSNDEQGINTPRSPLGKVARYARGEDYHHVLRERLGQLLRWIQEVAPGSMGRGVVDTAPLLERDFARRAGLGWFGKNTMLLHKRLGSYFLLGALLLDLPLQPDPAHETSHCGSCTACLDACPTQAFMGPGWLDSRRCISYLTIELKGEIPSELREPMGDWLFGCDICQEVCPWNKKAPPGKEPALLSRADLEAIDPAELLGLGPEEFRARFRGTALMRSNRRGLLRNAAIVLGNRGGSGDLPALRLSLADPEELVRDAARWAIEQIQLRYPEIV